MLNTSSKNIKEFNSSFSNNLGEEILEVFAKGKYLSIDRVYLNAAFKPIDGPHSGCKMENHWFLQLKCSNDEATYLLTHLLIQEFDPNLSYNVVGGLNERTINPHSMLKRGQGLLQDNRSLMAHCNGSKLSIDTSLFNDVSPKKVFQFIETSMQIMNSLFDSTNYLQKKDLEMSVLKLIKVKETITFRFGNGTFKEGRERIEESRSLSPDSKPDFDLGDAVNHYNNHYGVGENDSVKALFYKNAKFFDAQSINEMQDILKLDQEFAQQAYKQVKDAIMDDLKKDEESLIKSSAWLPAYEKDSHEPTSLTEEHKSDKGKEEDMGEENSCESLRSKSMTR